MSKRLRLACETSGDEGLPQYAVITLTAPVIERLLMLHEKLTELLQHQHTLSEMRYMECGDVVYYDRLHEFPPESILDLHSYSVDLERQELFRMDFTPIAEHVKLPRSAVRISSEYLCIGTASVYWLAVPKHVDGEIETRTISIEDLKNLLKELT